MLIRVEQPADVPAIRAVTSAAFFSQQHSVSAEHSAPPVDPSGEPGDPAWGDYFQARTLGDGPAPRGTFTYAAPFQRL